MTTDRPAGEQGGHLECGEASPLWPSFSPLLLTAGKEKGESGDSRRTPNDCPPPATSRRHLAVLLLILAIGAGVRLGLWVRFDGQPLNVWDEREYNALAVNLVEHGEYAFEPGKPDSLRPPLYPAVVAVVYRLFGAEN